MRMMGLAAAAVVMVWGGSAQAQSMNIPLIVRSTLTEVCIPWMQTGDWAAAMRAAQTLHYRTADLDTRRTAFAENPPSRILADGTAVHRGRIVMIESYDRVCSVDMAEGTVGQVSELAAEHLTALGMTRVLDRSGEAVGVVVWAGEGRQAVIGPSAMSSGTSITLNWLRPD